MSMAWQRQLRDVGLAVDASGNFACLCLIIENEAYAGQVLVLNTVVRNQSLRSDN